MGIDHVAEFLRDLPETTRTASTSTEPPLAREMAFNLRDFTSRGRTAPSSTASTSVNIGADEFVVLEIEQHPE